MDFNGDLYWNHDDGNHGVGGNDAYDYCAGQWT